jgi:hypothetical protein
MITFRELLGEFNGADNLVKIGLKDSFDFTSKDQVFLIESGSVLVYGEKDPKTGVRATQTFETHDPIGFAEAIASREVQLEFKPLTDLTLVRFDGAKLRKQVNTANIFSKTIIKYSLGRIFNIKRSTNNFAFEDDFINKKDKLFSRIKYSQDQIIFSAGSDSKKMFFIENGSVQIVSKSAKIVANLSGGECFGEGALLNNRPRNYTAIAQKESTLLVIEESIVDKELGRDSPLVRLSVLVLLKRLELMNKMRMV